RSFIFHLFFLSRIPPPPRSTLFPYTTLFRSGGFDTLYGHLSTALVKVGQPVTQGQVVGLEGSSGSSTGPHLHFELRINQRPVDRSEEHTSELQSRFDLVCRLLLEKKKKKKTI